MFIFVFTFFYPNKLVPQSKRRKSSPSLADQLKLSRRSARNKANTKANESSLVKSIWEIIPQHLMYVFILKLFNDLIFVFFFYFLFKV